VTNRAAGDVSTSVPTKLALLLVLAFALTACGSAHAGSKARTPASATGPPMRWVGTRGIEVAVPKSWPDNRGICGTPQANTVMWNEDGVALCAVNQPLGLSVVEFGGGFLRHPQGWYERHATPVRIDGANAFRWYAGTVRGSHEVVLLFPRRGMAVAVISPDRSLLRRILASVRAVRVDKDGCPTRPAGAYRLGSRPSPSRPLVPAGAVRVVACSYTGRWLDRSNDLGRKESARLTSALDAATYGFARAPRSSYLPSICGPTWRGSRIVARFEYPRGRPAVTVTAHVDGCTRLGASNGRWAVRFKPRWVHQLVRDARYGGAIPDPRTVR
jgi:hypothetical protein